MTLAVSQPCYDAEYAEMVLDIAEAILAVFEFSRTQVGFQHRPRDFLEELRGERGKEILLELKNLQNEVGHTLGS